VLQACLNGARLPADHPRLPVTAQQLAEDAARVLAAGAEDLHVHPKDPQGRDTLAPDVVAATLMAVRAAVPGVPVGVTTGAWTAGPEERAALVQRWQVLPDHASVNFHEAAAEQLAASLITMGVAVDAGLWTGTDGLEVFLRSALGPRCRMVLVEATEEKPGDAGRAAQELLAMLPPLTRVLMHGQEATAWPLYRLATELGISARMGLEDVLVMPDGSRAAGNWDLVRAAKALALV
jgi:uncharacterized protein (DUF849 family)